jgi:ATP-binding cassette subfamily B protein
MIGGTVVPEEIRGAVNVVLEQEPRTFPVGPRYTATEAVQPPFSLAALVRPARAAMLVAGLLVAGETALAQVPPLITRDIIDAGVIGGNHRTLVVGVVALVVAAILGAALSRCRLLYTGRLGQRLSQALRLRLFAHLQRLSLDHFTHERSGRILTRLTSDVEALTGLLQDGLVNIAVQLLTVVFSMTVLFTMSPLLAGFVAVALLPALIWSTVRFRRRSTVAYEQFRERLSEVVTDVQENVSGIRAVIGANRQQRNVAAHRGIVGSYAGAGIGSVNVVGGYSVQAELLFASSQVLVLGLGGAMVLHHALTVGELTAFLLYLGALFGPIQQLVSLYAGFQAGQAAVGKLRGFLSAAPSVPQSPTAVAATLPHGKVSFVGVSFGYRPDRLVLRDLWLDVEPGETLAVVGRTGAGKTTLGKLVPRLYDVTAGAVCLDGIDVRSLTFESLRQQVGVVPQEPFLFHGTLRDNLAFGRPELGDAALVAECEAFGLGPLLERLARGLDTEVTERGASLSAGERQLVCLARTSILRPRVLVLDEATSNLDQDAEQMVNAALHRVLDAQTSLVVAHRLPTALAADRVAVLVDGVLVEHGPPSQLIAAGGFFAKSYETWTTAAH